MVIEDFTMDAPATKKYLEVLKNFDMEHKKTLLVLPGSDHTIQLSARNLPKARVMVASDLNTFSILHADKLLLFESSIAEIENILLK